VLPTRLRQLPQASIRASMMSGLHRLYEAGFDPEDVVVDYSGVCPGNWQSRRRPVRRRD